MLSFQAYCSSLSRKDWFIRTLDVPVCDLLWLSQFAGAALLSGSLPCLVLPWLPQRALIVGRGHAVNLAGLQLKQMCSRPGGCLPEAANPSQVPGPGSMARCAPLPGGVFSLRESNGRRQPTCHSAPFENRCTQLQLHSWSRASS